MWLRILLCISIFLAPIDRLSAKNIENKGKRDPFASKRDSPDLGYFSLKLDHLEGEEVIKLLKQNAMLSEYGRAFFDKKSSVVVIYDEKVNFPMILKLIRQLDKRPAQIQIIAHIVTINRDCLSSFGINWQYEGDHSATVKSVGTNLAITKPTLNLGTTIASVAGNMLELQLAAFEAENKVEIMASPRLLTTHAMPASIRQGTEIPYEVASAKSGLSTIEFKEAVLGLEVVPRVLKDNYLELNLRISQNAVGEAIKRSEGGQSLTIDTEEIKTQVIVKQGQTLILGGIFQQNHHRAKKQVPLIGRLPVIGRFFQQKRRKEQRRELIIFITPKIISQ